MAPAIFAEPKILDWIQLAVTSATNLSEAASYDCDKMIGDTTIGFFRLRLSNYRMYKI